MNVTAKIPTIARATQAGAYDLCAAMTYVAGGRNVSFNSAAELMEFSDAVGHFNITVSQMLGDMAFRCLLSGMPIERAEQLTGDVLNFAGRAFLAAYEQARCLPLSTREMSEFISSVNSTLSPVLSNILPAGRCSSSAFGLLEPLAGVLAEATEVCPSFTALCQLPVITSLAFRSLDFSPATAATFTVGVGVTAAALAYVGSDSEAPTASIATSTDKPAEPTPTTPWYLRTALYIYSKSLELKESVFPTAA